MVCSLSCVGLLKANEKDSCHYCKRPVWKDNYYKINNNIYCSDICKDLILPELKIPKDSEKINHFNNKAFISINPIILKNTMQLREEVLKVYNDFKFDRIEDSNEKINQFENKQNNIKNVNNKEEKKIFNDKEYKLKIELNNINNKCGKTISTRKNVIHYIDKEISKENDLTNDKINNVSSVSKEKSYQKNDYTVKKTYTFNTQNNKNNILYDYKTNSKYKVPVRLNINKYESHYTFNKHNYGYNKTIKKESEKVNKDNNLDINDYTQKYNNTNQSLSNNNEISNINRNYSNDKNGYKSNISNPYNNYKLCKSCLGKIGNIKFLDRDGNNFCSDKCKKEFLNSKNKKK